MTTSATWCRRSGPCSSPAWTEIAAAFRAELAESKVSAQEFLQGKSPAWHLVGRVHFNLAENRKDNDAPFAFLATYTTQLSKHAKAQHVPLGRALSEYAGALDAIWYFVTNPEADPLHLSELDREPRVRDPQDLHERHELGAQIDS